MNFQTTNQLSPNKNLDAPAISVDPLIEEERNKKLSSLMQNFFYQAEINPKSSFEDLVSTHECRWTQEQFIPKFSDPLPPKQDKIFTEHLARCSSCTQEFQQFQQFKQSFSFPEIEPSRPIDQFWQKVRCRDFQDDFVAYLKQELTPARFQEIQTHLADCSSCSRNLREIQSNLSLVASVLETEITPSSQVWEKIQKELSQPLLKPKLSRLRLASSVIFMALGCLLLFSLIWQKRSLPDPRLVSGILSTSLLQNKILYQSPLSTETYLAQLEMNGIRLLVNKNTSFQLDSPYSIQLFQGEIFIDVPSGIGYNLTVTTPNASAFVLGTKFNIQANKTQTNLAVFQGKVLFGSSQKTAQAIRGTEASLTGENNLDLREVCDSTNQKELQKLEEQLLRRYQKNALTLALEEQSPKHIRILFKNHGILPLKIEPLRINSSAHYWSITGPYGETQKIASPTLCRNTTTTSSILLKPGQEHILDYDVSPYLTTSGDYELSLHYLFNEQREDSYWTGHIQSNSIRLHH